MKYLVTAMILLTVCFANAQIVNIPDSNFKRTLLAASVYNDVLHPTNETRIDINGDGEIQQSEAAAVTNKLVVNPQSYVDSITNFTGIQAFVNMKSLWMGILCNGTINLSGLTNLQVFNFNLNTSIEFSKIHLGVSLNGCTGLKELNLKDGNYADIDVSSCSQLESIYIFGAHLRSLQIGNIRKLGSFTYAANFNQPSDTIPDLDLTNCDSLARLELQNIYIRTLNISGLKLLYAPLNSTGSAAGGTTTIENFLARNCTALRYLSFDLGYSSFFVTQLLDLTGCVNLENLNIGYSSIPSLDLSTCYNLKVFTYNGPINLGNGMSSSPLKYLNLKNGSMLVSFTFAPNNFPANTHASICTDEFETVLLRSYFTDPNNHTNPNNPTNTDVIYDPLVNISPYCTFFPGGNYNTIQGKVRLDGNNNGCDVTDRGMPNVPLRIRDTSGNSLIRYCTTLGDYAYYPYKGLFTLTPYFPYPYFTVNPSATNVSFDTANSLLNTSNFCIQPNGVHNDLEITFLPTWPLAKPGFNAGYTLVYKNHGTTILSGNVQLNFDNSKMNFISASTNTTAQSTGQLTWNYNNLQPFESRTIDVTFNLLPPPINNINDTITYLATITPNSNDETPFDNSFILPQRVRGSFDPNEKQCLEGSKIDISKIGDYLHYQIHFQNEGTDTAFNVVVTDTLSSKLDWNSFELIHSSHPVSISNKSGKLEFVFENIKLPYKTINEPASNGYIGFKIKPTNTDVVGDSLNNKAAIYFDFNLPVITNTATTIITSATTPVPVKLEYFSVSKNNTGNVLNWKAACTNGSARFSIDRSDDGIHFSSIGNLTATMLRCQLPFNFTDNNPAAGKNYYRIKITDADGISFYSKTLLTGNNKSGIEITTISNNNIYLTTSKQQTIQLKIIAADGKQIYTANKAIAAGNNQINLPIKNQATGIYTLILYTNEGEVIIKKFVK